MKCLFISLLIGGILFSSCSDYSNSYSLSPQRKRVDLLNPIQGQISRYEMFRACGSAFERTGDTLILEVVERDGIAYFEERFSDASPIKSLDWARTIKSYPVHLENNRLYFPGRDDSFLFWFYDSDFLDLRPSQHVSLELDECYFDFPSHFYEKRKTGFVGQFQLGPDLILDSWLSPAGPGYKNSFLLFTERELHMSFFLNISFSRGFRLIHPGMDQI